MLSIEKQQHIKLQHSKHWCYQQFLHMSQHHYLTRTLPVCPRQDLAFELLEECYQQHDPTRGLHHRTWSMKANSQTGINTEQIKNKCMGHQNTLQDIYHTGCSKKTDPLVYFDDNFGKYGPILIIFSLLQQEIHDTQTLSYFSHLTFIICCHCT